MDNIRKTPDEILKSIKKNEELSSKGKLKIFFGYAAGVGKTYAMLEAAHEAKAKGIDVVIGYVEPHDRKMTIKLTESLEAIPLKQIKYGEITLNEFDLDEAIKRKPQLIIVDELAHTNAKGCRHNKRYQDIEELLNYGIDVYTTVNVQHIESLNDSVAAITGIIVKERIPDYIFDKAYQVKLVDIEPLDLIERLNNGYVYHKAQAKQATNNFFTPKNLTALREIALRRCADRVNLISENDRIKSQSVYYTEEHILVCLSSSPSNTKIIRTASKMANAFHGAFTALFVETPNFQNMSEQDKNRLRENINLAKRLGAKIETVFGEDIAIQISEFARLAGVSKIVVGRSNAKKSTIFSKAPFIERLTYYSPELDIYVIPDYSISSSPKYKNFKLTKKTKLEFKDFTISLLVLAIATLIGLGFEALGFTEANIVMIYLLGVLITSIVANGRIYSIINSIFSVIVFNFFFTQPKYTLSFYDKNYAITFIVMFIVAFISGGLATKIKEHAKKSAITSFRTKILFDTNQMFQQSDTKEQIRNITAKQLSKLLNRDIVIYLQENNTLKEPSFYGTGANDENSHYKNENEIFVANWCFSNGKNAGASTDTLSGAKYFYIPIKTVDFAYGVIGIYTENNELEVFEQSILQSIVGEAALAIENLTNAQEKEEAAILAKNEQLRGNLLRAISHDLRTPLTSISGNASNLMNNSSSFDDESRNRIYTDIYDESMWLINLVENLLSVSKIEEGAMSFRFNTELISEIIEEALKHINRRSIEHNIIVKNTDELLLVKVDARLIVQVIINIVDNAIKYTPANSTIEIFSKKVNNMCEISIRDNGNGISNTDKEKIFEMFYTGKDTITDSKRSLGLGLSLCKSIVNAHGGEISVTDNQPSGCIFKFTLPLEEVIIHE